MLAAIASSGAGCKAREPAASETALAPSCLALPGTQRRSLRADPAGKGLYWLERVHVRDFEGELAMSDRLVRYDLGTRKLEVLLDDVVPPLHVLGERVVIPYADGTMFRLAMVERGGRVQSLLPAFLTVSDVEQIDDHTLAVLASGDGDPAIYTLDLDEPRPTLLVHAEELISVAGGKVFARHHGAAMMVDLRTAAREPLALPLGLTPQGADSWRVEDSTVRVRAHATGVERTVIEDAAAWRLIYQPGSVIARTPTDVGPSRAFLLQGGAATPLPTLVGGTAIFSTTQLGDTLWALVGHNSNHVLGDLWEVGSEADVCSLPATGEVKLPSRQLPARFRKQQLRFFRALAEALPEVPWQVFEEAGAPTTLYAELPEAGGTDVAAQRARVRDIHAKVTSLLQDREVRTFLYFKDGRTAVQRWRRSRLRDRTLVGFADVFFSDPADDDVEIRDLDNRSHGATQLTCAGTLVNLTAQPLQDVRVRCSNAAFKAVIPVGELGPQQQRTFSKTFELVEDDEAPLFEVYSGRAPLAVRDAGEEAKVQQRYDLVVQVQAASGMILRNSTNDADALVLELQAPDGFTRRPDPERTAVLAGVHAQFATARALFAGDPELPVTLRITADDTTFDHPPPAPERRPGGP